MDWVHKPKFPISLLINHTFNYLISYFTYRYILYVGASDQAENKQQRRSSMAIVEIRLQGDLEEQTKKIVKTVTPRTIPTKSTNKLISQSTPFRKTKPTKTTSLFTPVQKVITVVTRPTASTLNPTVSSQHYVILNKQKSVITKGNRAPVLQQPQPTQPTLQRVKLIIISWFSDLLYSVIHIICIPQ